MSPERMSPENIVCFPKVNLRRALCLLNAVRRIWKASQLDRRAADLGVTKPDAVDITDDLGRDRESDIGEGAHSRDTDGNAECANGSVCQSTRITTICKT